MRIFTALGMVLALGFLAGCETVPSGDQAARSGMLESIRNEPAGDYYIGRRYYKVDYKFWGWVRRPRESWTQAKLVMLNEQQKLAPDRDAGKLGIDNNTEYKLSGRFSGDTVYEPASNGFYPEFVLTGIEVLDETPPPIYRVRAALDPAARVIVSPY
jgi:hypothetical protein